MKHSKNAHSWPKTNSHAKLASRTHKILNGDQATMGIAIVNAAGIEPF